MVGRQETNAKYKTRSETHLGNAPKYVSDYYYSLSEKTDSTKFAYVTRVINFLDYIKKSVSINDSPDSLQLITSSDIMRYLDYIRYKEDGSENSSSTRCMYVFAIKNFFDYLETEGYIKKNAAAKIKAPKINQDKEIRYLSNNEISRLISYVIKNGPDRWKYRDAAIMCLGFTSGLRISAICEINMEDIDFSRNTLQVVEKRNKERTIYLGERTVNILTMWCAYRKELLKNYDIDAVFFGKKRHRIDIASCNRILGKYTLDVFGEKYSPHKMRSSCATNLYEATGDLYLVQTQLGHTNPQTTMRYVKMSQKKMQQAAATMDSLLDI